MSLDASLRVKSGMSSKRSVYTRAERIGKLVEAKKIDPAKGTGKALGLAKTRIAK